MADETSPLIMPPNRRGDASVTPFFTSVNTAADDMRPLLTRVYSEPQLSSSRLQTDSGDFKSRRPFHVKPQNIVNSDDDAQERVSAQVLALNKRIQYYGKLSAADLSLIPPDHVIPAPDEIYVYSPLGTAFKVEQPADGVGKNPSIVTIFTIWNTMMGTSILSMPWGIKQAGFTFGIILIFLMGLLTLYCCYRVLTSRKTISDIDTSTWEFPDVCKFYFGSFGQWSSLLFSMISLVGAMIVYWVLMSNFLFNTGIFIYDFVHNINMTDDVPSTNGSEKVICPYPEIPKTDDLIVGPSNSSAGQTAFAEWWSKTKTVPFYLVVLILPLLNFKSASFFARFNVLGTISVVYLVILVTLKAARLGFHLEFHWFDTKADNFFVPEFRVLFPQLTGVLTLAFFIHNCIITLLKSNKNQENNVRDLSIAYLLVCLTYLYVGVLIFASFPSPPLSKDCIEPNFLDNFPSGDIMAVIARVFLLFQMTTVYPLLGYLVRVQLLGQLFGKTYPSVFHVLILNILVVGAGVAMAQLYPNIGGIIRYSGATCGLAFVFVYPSLIHIIALYRQEQLRWHSVLLHGLLIVAGLANLIAQFIT